MSTSLINKQQFIPSRLSNLAVWLDSADPSTIIQSGGYVTQWNDKSQNQNNFLTGITPTLNPATLSVSYDNSGVFFPPNNYAKSSNLPSFAQSKTIIAVYRCSDLGSSMNIGLGTPITGDLFGICQTGGNTLYSPYLTPPGSLTFTINSNYAGINYSFASYDASKYTVTGNFRFDDNTLKAVTLDNTVSDTAIVIGISSGMYTSSNFTLYELIATSNAISASDRQEVEGYLATKWGLQSQLPLDHPYYNFLPSGQQWVTATLPYNISGLASWLDMTLPIQSLTTIYDIASSTTPTLYNASTYNLELSTLQGYNALTINPYSPSNIPLFRNIPAPSSGSILFVYTQNGQTVAGQGIVGWGANDNTSNVPYGPILAYADSPGQLFAKNGGTNQSFNGGPSYNVSSGVPTLVFFGWDTSNFYISVNGNQQIVTTYAEIGKGNMFCIGYAGNNGTIPSMTIGELLLYTQYLEQSERQILEGYLSWKWGIVKNLSQSHPFKIQAPINATQKEQFPLDIPSQFESLTTWLDAADTSTIQLDYSNVMMSWSDKSSSVDIFSNNTSNNVTYSITDTLKLPGVFFSSTGSMIGTINPPYYGVRLGSCFLVATSGSRGVQVMRGALATGSYFTSINGNSFGFFAYGSNTFAPYQGYNSSNQNRFLTTTGRTSVLFARFDASDTKLPAIGDGSIDFINPKNYGNNSEEWIPTLPDNTPWVLGYTQGIATEQSFFLHEFIFLSEYVTDTKRQLIEGYLAWKWGLQSQLPPDHPYVNARPQSM